VLTLLLLRDPAKALSNTGAALVSSEDMSSSAVLESVAGDHSVATYVHSPVMDDGGGGASPEPLLIHREPNSNGLNSSDGDLAYADAKPRSRCARFFAIFEPLRLLYHPRMLVLIPLMSYSGLSQGYMYGDVPPLVDKKSTKFFVLAVIGGADALASMVMGKLSDKIGRVRTMAIGFACALSAIIFMWQWTVDQRSATRMETQHRFCDHSPYRLLARDCDNVSNSALPFWPRFLFQCDSRVFHYGCAARCVRRYVQQILPSLHRQCHFHC
jgi:hypothetical protein